MSYTYTNPDKTIIFDSEKRLYAPQGSVLFQKYKDLEEASTITISDYNQPDISMQAIRNERDRMLDESDLRDINAQTWEGLTSQQKTDWATWKQAMRDLPDNINLTGVKDLQTAKSQFPTKPS